jgi:hypothetical protein
MTEPQMIEALAAVDRQLDEAAQPLARRWSDPVLAALSERAFSDGVWRRLSGGGRGGGATQAAIDALNQAASEEADDPALLKVEALLQRRRAQLERIRRHLRLKALLEVWLYVHVPATFALLAALTAHVVSVFFYW